MLVEMVKSETEGTHGKQVILLGILYSIIQALLFFLPIPPAEDYYNHINWGIGYYQDGLYPYSEFSANEYPVVSVWGWIYTWRLSPKDTYAINSISQNLPYWILAVIGGYCFYKILHQDGFNERNALILVTFYFFNPLNFIDTITNHGSLGTASTFMISLYLWRQNKHFFSSFFIALGIGIKIYPIFALPFLIWSMDKWKGRFKYGFYTFFWLIVIHIPVLRHLDSYYEVLFERTSRRAGIGYSKTFEVIGTLFNFSSFATVIWIGTIVLGALFLLNQNKLNIWEKFTLLLIINNMTEPRGGVGHMNAIIPFLIIYFFYQNQKKFSKNVFIAYMFWGSIFLYKRIIPGYSEYRIDDEYYIISVFTFLMTILTTLMVYLYVKGLSDLDKIDWKWSKLNIFKEDQLTKSDHS